MNPPGATWIRGKMQVNHLHLKLHEANETRSYKEDLLFQIL